MAFEAGESVRSTVSWGDILELRRTSEIPSDVDVGRRRILHSPRLVNVSDIADDVADIANILGRGVRLPIVAEAFSSAAAGGVGKKPLKDGSARHGRCGWWLGAGDSEGHLGTRWASDGVVASVELHCCKRIGDGDLDAVHLKGPLGVDAIRTGNQYLDIHLDKDVHVEIDICLGGACWHRIGNPNLSARHPQGPPMMNKGLSEQGVVLGEEEVLLRPIPSRAGIQRLDVRHDKVRRCLGRKESRQKGHTLSAVALEPPRAHERALTWKARHHSTAIQIGRRLGKYLVGSGEQRALGTKAITVVGVDDTGGVHADGNEHGRDDDGIEPRPREEIPPGEKGHCSANRE